MDDPQTIVVTGGAGFIGSNFVLQWIEQCRLSAGELRRADLCGECRESGVAQGGCPTHFGARGYLRCGSSRSRASRTSAESDRAFCSRKPCRPLDCRSGRIYSHQRAGHSFLLEQAKRYWVELDPARREAFRFLHVSTDEVYGSLGPDDPPFSETTAVRAEQSVCGIEGCLRSSRAGVSPHLRSSGADDKLLEQLRPLSVSGEADSR